jgi:hypothetical protein
VKVLTYASPAKGHAYPLTPIVAALAERGHEVSVRTREVPPFGLGLVPLEGPLGRARDGLVRALCARSPSGTAGARSTPCAPVLACRRFSVGSASMANAGTVPAASVAPGGARRQPRKRWLIALGVATVAFFVLLAAIDPGAHSAGPNVIAFEFAATPHRAARILAEWGPKGRDYARLSLWLDYGFMVSYGAFFTLAGLTTRDLARVRRWRRMATLGAVVPFLAAAAALFDASENVALLLTVGGHGGSFAPPFATVCASLKFALITTAEVYVLVGLLMGLRERFKRAVPQV